MKIIKIKTVKKYKIRILKINKGVIKMRLYEITGAMDDVLDIFLESDGNELDKENYEYTINYLKEELKNKSSNFIKYIKNLLAEAEMAKQEAERLTAIRKTKEHKVENLKKYLVTALQGLEIKKIETELGSYGLRKSTSVEILDITKIPKEFIKIKEEFSVDKKELGKYMDNGNYLEGAVKIENYTLQIR